LEYNKTTLEKFESFLGNLVLHPDLFKIKNVEMDLKGNLNPSNLLHELYFVKEKWLSFQEFFDHYFALFKDRIKNQFSFSSHESFSDGLRARLYRTQFGFLTEYHAFLLSSILFTKENVYRNPILDQQGVDFQIKYCGNLFNIHIFVDTQRAWHFRNYKSAFKNVEKTKGIHVNLPYSLKEGRFNSLRFLKNGFGVYTEEYFEHFKSEIISGKIKNNNITGTNENGFIYSH